jgi:hypothetical protein
MLRLCSIILALAILTVLPKIAVSQSIRDNLGREFFVAFGPNTGGEPDVETENAMILEIFSAKPALVNIEMPALGISQVSNVQAGVPKRIELPNGNKGTSSVMLTRADNEKVLKGRAVHITSDEDIAVYGLDHKRFSEDAFLTLPTDVLGSEYRIASFNASNTGQGAEMPGQFMVVASEDATTVTIVPTCRTAGGKVAGDSYEVVLDRGDVYLVQSAASGEEDLTGSHITSNKPVAVFSGHERCAIPSNAKLYDGSFPSRDHLVEQLPPVQACGDSIVVVPFKSSDRPDVVRVIATADGTEVLISGVFSATLKGGEFYEMRELKTPTMITASKPVLVAQYLGTTLGKLADAEFPSHGDPSMMIVPPIEQYLTRYSFNALSVPAAGTAFVSVVLPASAVSETTIDDVTLQETSPIAGTDFVYSTKQLSPGVHSLKSTVPIGAYLYAFSDVASYAMSAGMGVETGGLTHSYVSSAIMLDRVDKIVIAQGNSIVLPMEMGTGELRVFDRAGRMMEVREIAASQDRHLNVSRYSSGIYFYRVSGVGGTGHFLVP